MKYEGRIRAIAKKIPKEAEAPFYSFTKEADGTYTDDCGNVYTAEEFEALTCNAILFDWPSSKEQDERIAGINARQLTQTRRLKHLYDKERLKYGLKPPFAAANPEDIPEDCRTGGGNGLEEDSQEDNSSGWIMLQK